MLQNPLIIEKTQKPSGSLLLIIAVMTVAILEILDSTIVNVALPHMMNALGADQDQIIWIVTSYMVASAVVIPLTGYLHNLMGERKLILINIIGFAIASSLCGAAPNLAFMVVTRFLQGIFGASLIPLSQIILRNSFPKEEIGKAMAIWGAGIMSAPVLGPTLGGYITEFLDWRWIFYINIPICIAAVTLILFTLKPTRGKYINIDGFGILFLVIGTSSLQLFLDQGNSKGWFDSLLIISYLLLALIGIVGFIYRGLIYKNSAVNIKIFANKNFLISTLILVLFCGTFMGTLTTLPIMQQSVFHYTTLITGLVQAPRGLASSVAMILLSRLPQQRLNMKYFMIVGLILCSISSWFLGGLTPRADDCYFIIAGIIGGIGMGFVLGPLTNMSLMTLDGKHVADASGLFSYGRTLGMSIGISLSTTILTRSYQFFWHLLVAHVSLGNPNYALWVQKVGNMPFVESLSILKMKILNFSHLLSYIQLFDFASFIFIFLIPLVLLLSPSKKNSNVIRNDSSQLECSQEAFKKAF